MTLPIALAFISVLLVGVFLLVVFGQREDAGFSLAQKVIRSFYRLSRWSWSVGRALDAYLVAYYQNQAKTNLPELKSTRELHYLNCPCARCADAI
jgi:hypothetical protein